MPTRLRGRKEWRRISAPDLEAITEWSRLAKDATIVRRAVSVAAVVGSVLIMINHGDAILRGDLSPARVFRMALTILVPYCVSTYSSVQALRRPGPGLKEK
jgi:hypothetical protein